MGGHNGYPTAENQKAQNKNTSLTSADPRDRPRPRWVTCVVMGGPPGLGAGAVRLFAAGQLAGDRRARRAEAGGPGRGHCRITVAMLLRSRLGPGR